MILFFLIVILKDPRGPKKALGQKYNHKRQLIKSPIKKHKNWPFFTSSSAPPTADTDGKVVFLLHNTL